jgi:Tfp pilus assembly protein PilN
MRAVNLLPSESLRASGSGPSPVVLAAAITGTVVVIVLAGGNLLESTRASSAQKALNNAQLALGNTPLPPKNPAFVAPPAAVVAQLQPRLSAVSAALSTRIAWDRILREFSLVLPSDIQVDGLTLTQPIAGSTTATGPNGLTLQGVTYSYDAVARLVSRLALIPDLTNVQLSNTAVNQGVVQFSITAGVKGGAPTAPVAGPAPAPPTTTTGSTS